MSGSGAPRMREARDTSTPLKAGAVLLNRPRNCEYDNSYATTKEELDNAQAKEYDVADYFCCYIYPQ